MNACLSNRIQWNKSDKFASGNSQAAFFRQLFGGAPGGAVTLGFFAPGNYTVRATLDGEVRETGAWLSPGEGSTVEIRF